MKARHTIWIVAVAVILALIPAGVLFYQKQQLKIQLAEYAGQKNVDYQALTDSLQRAETKIARTEEELAAFADQYGVDFDTILEDHRELGARVEAVGASEARTTTVVHNHYPSDSSNPSDIEVPTCEEDGRPIDVHGYTKRVETRRLEDSNGMVVADVSFSAARERPWSSRVYGVRYRILNTVGRGAGGQVILTTELTAENPEAQPGETFRIEGVESRVLQAPEPGPEFRWWDPAVYLLAQPALVVYDEVAFSASLSIGFSVFSYGENWRFLGITAGYDAFQNAFRASLVPVLYNVGGPLPFLSDLWIGLDVGISHESDVSVGLVIGTRL